MVDVRNANEVDTWIGDIVKIHGRIDGGANVAGIGGGWRPTTVGNIVRSPVLLFNKRYKVIGIS